MGRSLATSDRCDKDIESGVLLYAGLDRLLSGDKRMLALPLDELWSLWT